MSRVHRIPTRDTTKQEHENAVGKSTAPSVAVSVPLNKLGTEEQESKENKDVNVPSSVNASASIEAGQPAETESLEEEVTTVVEEDDDDDEDLSLLEDEPDSNNQNTAESDTDEEEEGFLEVYSENCLQCKSLIPFMKKKFKSCHFSTGNKNCPASKTSIVIRVPLEEIVPRYLAAEKANDFSRLAKFNLRLAGKPEWFQQRVAQAIAEARNKK